MKKLPQDEHVMVGGVMYRRAGLSNLVLGCGSSC